MREEVKVFIEEEKLNARIREVAEQINEDYAGKKIHLVCILKGSVFFTCDLANASHKNLRNKKSEGCILYERKTKDKKKRKPLIIQGARQVGKTWIMKEFGKRYFENVIYILFIVCYNNICKYFS